MAQEKKEDAGLVIEIPASVHRGDVSNPLYGNPRNTYPGGCYVVGNEIHNGNGEKIGNVKVIEDMPMIGVTPEVKKGEMMGGEDETGANTPTPADAPGKTPTTTPAPTTTKPTGPVA